MNLVSVPLIAAGLTELRHGRFSFYPAIVGVRHNEWVLRRATWTDILVANAKTAEELWIPRRLVGEVSSIAYGGYELDGGTRKGDAGVAYVATDSGDIYVLRGAGRDFEKTDWKTAAPAGGTPADLVSTLQ